MFPVLCAMTREESESSEAGSCPVAELECARVLLRAASFGPGLDPVVLMSWWGEQVKVSFLYWCTPADAIPLRHR